jgi:hypothetical protein
MPAKNRENPILKRSLTIDVELQSLMGETISQEERKNETKNRKQAWPHKCEPLSLMLDASDCRMNSFQFVVRIHID